MFCFPKKKKREKNINIIELCVCIRCIECVSFSHLKWEKKRSNINIEYFGRQFFLFWEDCVKNVTTVQEEGGTLQCTR